MSEILTAISVKIIASVASKQASMRARWRNAQKRQRHRHDGRGEQAWLIFVGQGSGGVADIAA